MNYTNRMKCRICLDGFIKDIDLETFNCWNVTEVEIYLVRSKYVCTQYKEDCIVTTDGTKYQPPSNIVTIVGWNGKWLTITLVIIRKRIILVILLEKKRKFDKIRNIRIFDMRKKE